MEIFLQFLQFTENITSTERLFILDVVLKQYWGVQHTFQRRSARFALAHVKNIFIRQSKAVLDKTFWHASAQHSV